MKKTFIGTMIFLFMLLATGVRAQGQTIVLQAGEEVKVRCEGERIRFVRVDELHGIVKCLGADVTSTPTATETATGQPTETSTNELTETPTETPIPSETPTNAPSTTSTAIPSPTPTPTEIATSIPSRTTTPQGTVTPFASAPLCPSHDLTLWHNLWDSTRGCHYDHTHNADPALGNGVFGAVNYSSGISYPWLTSALENTHKHGGYKYGIRLNLPCDPNRDFDGSKPVHCITDARIQYHMIGHSMDALARFHSYYAEYRICQYPAFTQCGIMRTGGWVDFGILVVPYAGPRVVRPGGTLNFGDGMLMTFAPDDPELDQQGLDQPYVAMSDIRDESFFRTYPQNINSPGWMEVWSVGDLDNRYGHNPYARFLVSVTDSWGLIDPNDPNALHWFCRDGSCGYNASIHALNELSVNVLTAWDADGDGLANYQGYTDRWGHVVQGCGAPALDCVPFSVVHVPVGIAHYSDPGVGVNARVEYDMSPSGTRWIRFPN